MISAEEVRKNCEEYKKNLELRYARKRKEYIEELEQKIIDESKRGGYWITSANNLEKDFIDSEFLNEIKINFENKGFKVESQWGYAGNEEKNTINNTYNNIFINFLRLYN